MITRSYGSNGQFELQDWTQEIVNVPIRYGTINNLGLFVPESVAENTVVFEEISFDGGLILDRIRGERAQVGKDATRKLHTFPIPHFPYDDAILPQDIQGKRAYGSPDAAETLAAVRVRKMERIMQNHAQTLEYARALAITSGTVYAPNGTVSHSWFTEFGVAQQTVDFVLGTSTTEVLLKIEEALVKVQDAVGNRGGVLTGLVALTSPEFFNKLITHPTVKAAYQFFRDTQDPTRGRAGGVGVGVQRRFSWGGVDFIEVRDSFAGQRTIPAGEAYLVPTGTDYFKTYFAPCSKFDFLGTLGEPLYMFEFPSMYGDKIEIQTETNFANMVSNPLAAIKLFSSN